MPLALVPNLLSQNPEDRYEEIMNELLNFGDEWWQAYDQKALRIVLAAVWMRRFTTDRVPWLWCVTPPKQFGHALGACYGRPIHCPKALAGEGLIVATGQEGIFHRSPADIESTLRQYADLEFESAENTTVISCTGLPMDRLQASRCQPAWPIVQNTFVNVRFEQMGMDPAKKWEICRKWNTRKDWDYATKSLRQLILNLMDEDFRNPRHRAKETAGLFDGLTYLKEIVAALRGPGFDVDLLAQRAITLAMAHASMMGKREADAEEYALCRRVVVDAIPSKSLKILKCLPLEGWWTAAQLEKSSLCSRETVQKLISSTTEGLIQKAPRHARVKKTQPDYYQVSPELQQVLMCLD